MTLLSDVESFLEREKPAHHRVFPAVPQGSLVGFLGTTSTGSGPSFGVNQIIQLAPGERGRGIELSVEGQLPTQPVLDENIAALVVNLPKYRGYQLKSDAADTHFSSEDGRTLIFGRSVYTVHHSPNVLNVFEKVPFEEVSREVAGVRHAVLAVGRRVNISPRFIFHYERRGRELVLFHGDGLVHKTYLNLKENPAISYLICDVDFREGYTLGGVCEEQPADAPGEGPDRVRAGFAALGFELSRIFVTHVTRTAELGA